jgi:hypothetical protein
MVNLLKRLNTIKDSPINTRRKALVLLLVLAVLHCLAFFIDVLFEYLIAYFTSE